MAHAPALVPLFGAIPGGPELLFAGLLGLVVPVGLALWVGLDAREHSDHPLAWGLTVLVAGLTPLFIGAVAVTLLYVISKDELGSYAPPTFSESDMDDETQVLGQPLGAQRQPPGVGEEGTGATTDGPTDEGDANDEPTAGEPSGADSSEGDDAPGTDEQSGDARSSGDQAAAGGPEGADDAADRR